MTALQFSLAFDSLFSTNNLVY